MGSEPRSDPVLQPGLSAEVTIVVTEAETAAQLGSGLVPVYATPALVALMENAAVRVLEGRLPPGQTSVGAQIDLRHMAATPVGMQVRTLAQLAEVQGRKLTFHIQAWDEEEQIGDAEHVRYIVNEEKFLAKAHAKASIRHTQGE